MSLLDFAFPVFTLAVAIASVIPAIMSVMLFDAPGSHNKAAPWCWFIAVWIWVFGMFAISIVNFLAPFGILKGCGWNCTIYLFLFCLGLFAVGAKLEK
jgi:hypothetical protein